MSDLKKEGQSPEEYWKAVSNQLSNKKYEDEAKTAMNKINLNEIKKEIEKFNADMMNEIKKESVELYEGKKLEGKKEIFYNLAFENSYVNKPLFNELEPDYSKQLGEVNNVKRMDKIQSGVFPKTTFYRFNDPSFFKKFDLDTLFFIFHYFKNTVQQTYAAIRLKSLAWRFNTKYKIWFSRLEEPTLITEQYEKGDFLFFDANEWVFMKKPGFVFEYCYLEHNDHFK